MPHPADDLAQLLPAVLAYRPQPWAWPRPRPPSLPHPRRRLPRVRGWCGAQSPVTLGAYLYLPHDWLGLELPPPRSHLSAD
jgi:hypothetical protein